MRTVGLHLRISKDLITVVERAQKAQLSSFQCFLVHQETKKRLEFSDEEYRNFLKQRNTFGDLYVHGAYWINLCGKRNKIAHYLVNRELDITKRLGFSHYLLHPGSAQGWQSRMEGIDCLVRALNTITTRHSDITIVLENTAHAGQTIGSDLQDFLIIREKLNNPEKIQFCIDTAHAHGFGYDVVTPAGQKEFIDLLEKTVGIDAIALIHLNDSNELPGTFRDQHAFLGQGKIGLEALRRFIHEPRLVEKPIILELPDSSDSQQEDMIKLVCQSHK
jgi:deoxyribonuclease-4